MTTVRHQNIPAAYLILINDNKILLLRRFNTGYEDGNYSLIAGHVEKGESFSECIVREAKEEAGIIVKHEDLKVVHVMHRNSEVVGQNERLEVFFSTDKWDGDVLNMEPSKCDDLSWFEVDSMPDNVVQYVRHALEGVKVKTYYSEYGWKLL